jgi:alkanesulfonate monooxygenase SsuD/methylene tetrahydromethanopterin reductase-like flavin-dependent oxidoreductase (luciferase family)
VIEGFHGRKFEKPLTQTRDVLKVVRGLLRGESLDQVGAELTRYRPFKLATKHDSYRVPVYVAALKQKAIESVGELADGWMPAFWPYADLPRGLSWLHEGARRAGRDPSSLEVALVTAAIPLGKKRSLGMAKDILSFYIGGMGEFYRELLSGMGFAEDCAKIAALYQNQQTRSQAKHAVPDRLVEAMTAVGDPLECRAQLAALHDVGVTQPLLGLPAAASWPAIAAYLYTMAPTRTPSLVQLMTTGALRVAGRVEGLSGR